MLPNRGLTALGEATTALSMHVYPVFAWFPLHAPVSTHTKTCIHVHWMWSNCECVSARPGNRVLLSLLTWCMAGHAATLPVNINKPWERVQQQVIIVNIWTKPHFVHVQIAKVVSSEVIWRLINIWSNSINQSRTTEAFVHRLWIK